MNGKTIGGIVVIALGVVIVAILCGLGGYAKQAVHDGVTSRLEYELPEGYKKDPNFEHCYRSVGTPAFDEEYYLWNLTNQDAAIAGEKANFDLVGPFSYTENYCEYEHKIDEADGILTYKRYTNGYFYMPSTRYPTDDVLITNVNPAYLGLTASLGGQNTDQSITVAVMGPALMEVINQIQSAALYFQFVAPIPNFTDYENFGYAQWGSLVAGASLLTAIPPEVKVVPFAPEIAALDAPCYNYTTEQAKELLNGTRGLFQPVNMITFLTLMGNLSNPTNAAIINAYWGLDPTRASCLVNYLNTVVVAKALVGRGLPQVLAATNLFITRSVREWMFTGTDRFLNFSRPNGPDSNSLKSNTIISKENAITTRVRIYTGKNDLHHSLMPVNEGDMLTFWKTPVPITGYNGSQFLPHGYVDDAKKQETYPLELFHKDINRSIPFQNKGKDEWNGVKVRYLTLSDTALASETINPANAPYYAQYSGAINKTSNPPSFLPIFLTTPNFNSAEPHFTENVTFTDTVMPPYDKTDPLSRNRLALFILVEPTLGSAVWGNLPIQINFKVGPSARYPNLRPAYYPMYWNAIGDIATADDLDDIKTTLYGNQRAWKIMIGVGVGAGVSLIIAGIVLVHHFRKHENELKD